MAELIGLSCWATLALVIWFETDAFIHYARVFGLSLRFHIVAYEDDLLRDQVDYLDFLRIKYPHSFWINLVTCPTCLSVWLAAIVTLSGSISFFYFPLVNLISLSLFFIIKKLY